MFSIIFFYSSTAFSCGGILIYLVYLNSVVGGCLKGNCLVRDMERIIVWSRTVFYFIGKYFFEKLLFILIGNGKVYFYEMHNELISSQIAV